MDVKELEDLLDKIRSVESVEIDVKDGLIEAIERKVEKVKKK